MITYNSPKFNQICKEFTEILENNNINIDDSEQAIDECVLNLLIEYVHTRLESVNSFVNVPCPKCGNPHLVPMQTTYTRNIIFKIKNLLIKLNISIPRLKCHNCDSTHAILPSFCVPFKQYSKQAILEIVAQADETSTQEVADCLDIDSKQVRRFVNIFLAFNNDILLLYQIYSDKFKQKIDNNSKVNIIINSLSIEFEEIFFREFRKIYLYIKIKRNIYISLKNYLFKIT